eukprot:TRINITY_DN1852_c0_g1_i1.p1 TRINITY_DN1852_c0_g1~~TRINITY_DN1852_c0_g1_i1.p1  ORF type:complete len:360 (+),score=86.22 TRINITY_DN1852_c0_g1_i1:207-1286(+)
MELRIIEALELYEGCVRCFIMKKKNNKFDDQELLAHSLLSLSQFLLFANDLTLIHRGAACMLKEAQLTFQKVDPFHKELPNVHIQLGFFFLKQKTSLAQNEFQQALELFKQQKKKGKQVDLTEILEVYVLITMVITIKKTMLPSDQLIMKEAMKMIQRQKLFELEKQNFRMKHSVVAIRNNRAIMIQRNGRVKQAITILEENLDEQYKLPRKDQNMSDIQKTQDLIQEFKDILNNKEDPDDEDNLKQDDDDDYEGNDDDDGNDDDFYNSSYNNSPKVQVLEEVEEEEKSKLTSNNKKLIESSQHLSAQMHLQIDLEEKSSLFKDQQEISGKEKQQQVYSQQQSSQQEQMELLQLSLIHI